MAGLAEALIASGWCRSEEGASKAIAGLPIGADVLPILAEVASRTQTSARPQTRRPSAGRPTCPIWADVLDAAMQRGAKLTLGWPVSEARPPERWIGPRLLWWPRGIPEGRNVAWVSSRLGRAIDERPDWFAVLRSAVAKLDPQRDVLLTASSTTVDRFLERAAILFGLRRLRVHLDERRTLNDWLTQLRRQLWRSCVTEVPALQLTDDSEVFVSPILNRIGEPEGVSPRTDLIVERCPEADAPRLAESLEDTDGQECPSSELPLSDRVLIAAADQVLALQVRPKGNLHQLLRARLSDSAWPKASVWLALGESLVSTEVASELQSLGAVGWWLFVAEGNSVHHLDSTSATADAGGGDHDILTKLPWPDGDYLVHWTRRRDGPWPEQSAEEFLDDLLLSRDSVGHSAFAALSRIVRQRRLTASAAAIRGETPVVSFSANPLSELTNRRTFRTHRGRWDCEAYGLCVRREWLEAQGAKPVIYGNDDLWTSLADSDRAFFQLKTTRSRRGAKAIDWSQEAEWRVPHDVDLSEAGRDNVLLFVPTQAEARQLAAISPWPVLVLATSQNPSVTPATTPHC
jgi:hypothetical protein